MAIKSSRPLKFMFSKKAKKIDKIFTVVLTVSTYCQIDGEDFVNFCGLLRKRELYLNLVEKSKIFLSLIFESLDFVEIKKAFNEQF